MNNKKIVLNLYKSKIKLCMQSGYKLGSFKSVEPHFNLARSLIKCKKINNKKRRANYIMNHVRQGYKDNIHKNDNLLINLYIDEGFQVLRNLNNLLNLKKKTKNIKVLDQDDYIFFDYFEN